MTYLIAGGIAWLTMGVLGAWVATQKRRSESEGLILGLVFGPLGVLIEAMMPIGDVRPIKRVEPIDRAAERRQEWLGFGVVVAGLVSIYVVSYIFGR